MRINRLKKYMMCAGLAVTMISTGIISAYGSTTGQAEATMGTYRVEGMKAAEDASQLIVVIGDGTSKVTVSYYQKETTYINGKKGPGDSGTPQDTWKEVFTTPGVYGKNGAATAELKREGDGKTPTGVYSFTTAFGLKEDPGSVLPYHKIQHGDYWVDDSDSAYYNQLVNINQTPKSWKSAEDMMAMTPYYNYALALDYNQDCVPGAGSAIFIHCTKSADDTGSQGCIRIPEELMKLLVQSVDGKTKIVIVSEVNELSLF